jgi:hypothetical protein
MKVESLPPPVCPLCIPEINQTELIEDSNKKETDLSVLRLLALETIHTRYAECECQSRTMCKLFAFCILGPDESYFEGELAVNTSLKQLFNHIQSFDKQCKQ